MNRRYLAAVVAALVVVAIFAAGLLIQKGLHSSPPVPTTTGTTSLAETPVPEPPVSRKITLGQAAVLGVVEGLTEYLPVSSTGHLILTAHYMGLTQFSEETGPFGRKLVKNPAINAFEIVIQFGAILAVIGLYRKRVGQMAMGLLGRDTDGLRLLALLMVAFLPAAVVGLKFHRVIEDNLFGPIPVIWALAIGGVLILVVEYFYRRRRQDTPRITQVDRVFFWQALVIGLAQCLAMWPGTSRSMITILAALIVGLDMLAAAEFSFLLALPTLGAATFYSLYKDAAVLKDCAGVDSVLVGLIVSGIVAAIAVKALVTWLTRHGLTPFGLYRIALAIVLYFVLSH